MFVRDLPRERRSWPRRLLNRLEIGQAVFFAVALRIWQLAAGVVTVILMARHFSLEVQGFYFTFASLVALQTFFELGLSIAVINICSHEWARLELSADGTIAGSSQNLSRLVSFGRQLFRWYGAASLLFVGVVSVAGTLFLEVQSTSQITWRPPWFALVVVSGLLLWTLPYNAMLEGCNQVVSVNRFRLLQAITASVAVWIVMTQGGGLWTAVAATGARLLTELGLFTRYRRFFAPFLHRPAAEQIDWWHEVLPLQWRLAVGAVLGYFAYFLLCPVMFAYHGATLAGQMGLTWTVVTTIQGAALAWVQTRAPLFGMLVNRGDRRELDRVFFRVVTLGAAVFFLGAAAFWLLISLLNAYEHWIAERLLEPTPTAILLAGALIQLLVSALAFYVRAHKKEPFLWVGMVSNVLIGLAIWQLGSRYGASGAAGGLLLVNSVFTLPTHFWLWAAIRNQEWRGSG